MSVTFAPSPARLSDEPTLALEIAYAQGIAIRKPERGSTLGDFIIRDFREPPPRIEGDLQILQQIYTLEPTRAGKFVIDPISIAFTDNQAAGSDKEHTIETEPITVEVAAAVAQEAPSLDQLRGRRTAALAAGVEHGPVVDCRVGGARPACRGRKRGGCSAARGCCRRHFPRPPNWPIRSCGACGRATSPREM